MKSLRLLLRVSLISLLKTSLYIFSFLVRYTKAKLIDVIYPNTVPALPFLLCSQCTHHLKYHPLLSSEVQILLLLKNPIQIHPVLKITKGFNLLCLLEAFFTLSNIIVNFHVMITFNNTIWHLRFVISFSLAK